jgi:hypothetical protein
VADIERQPAMLVGGELRDYQMQVQGGRHRFPGWHD